MPSHPQPDPRDSRLRWSRLRSPTSAGSSAASTPPPPPPTQSLAEAQPYPPRDLRVQTSSSSRSSPAPLLRPLVGTIEMSAAGQSGFRPERRPRGCRDTEQLQIERKRRLGAVWCSGLARAVPQTLLTSPRGDREVSSRMPGAQALLRDA
ncbi:uncharacterized protein LOC144581459 [Callithrix jacchus]